MSYISAVQSKDKVKVWERNGPDRELVFYKSPLYFYIEDPKGDYTSLFGDKCSRIDFDRADEFHSTKKQMESSRIKMFESDISPTYKVLAENYYGKEVPNLHISYLDIEVDYDKTRGFSSVADPYAPINAISFYNDWKDELMVLAVPPETWGDKSTWEDQFDQSIRDNAKVIFFETENELLKQLIHTIQDADVLCGWNSDFFDIPYIGKRVELVLGKTYFNMLSFPGAPPPKFRDVEVFGNIQQTLDLGGRIGSDYMVLFKKFEQAERPSYKLESISNEVLPDLPKLPYEGTLADLYRNDFNQFIRYSKRDTECLRGFEEELGYVALANNFYHLSTGLYPNVNGTIKLAELALVNFCHHELDVVAPNVPQVSTLNTGKAQGAFVLKPKAGLHKRSGSVDFTSLYPKVIQSINISPETLIGQFSGMEDDYLAIYARSNNPITFLYETGEREIKPANVWRKELLQRGWAVSGYGTVFDQAEVGIIPSILNEWYLQRKKYKKMAAESKKEGDKAKAEYYDRLQYCYKIKLNSLYGALLNKHFRFYDPRMGESTTGTGRAVLKHMCGTVNEELTGTYDIGGESIIYGDSVAANTLIDTESGKIEIQELFEHVDYTKGTKEYSNIKCKALTFCSDSNQNEFRDVKYIVRHKVNKKMFRVWIGNTRYIDVTEDHSLMGYNNVTKSLVRVKPTELKTGKIKSLILNSNIPTDNKQTVNISNEMCQLIGLIIGDGHVGKQRESGVGLSLGNQDKDEIISKLITPLIEQKWFISVVHMENTHDIRLCGVKGWFFLRDCLYPSGTKQFPEWIYSLTVEQITHVLTGYFTADGFINKSGTIGLCSINPDFINTANKLLLMCGIPSNFWTETTENSFKGKKSGTDTIRLTVYNAVKFGRDIGFILDRKHNKIRKDFSQQRKHQSLQSGYTLISSTKIEEINYDDYVYDIEVDDTHTFYANDLLVHNTDSCYFDTFSDTDEEAVAVSDAIADKVNKVFPAFMEDSFLCTDGYRKHIAVEREVVTSSGIFVKPKMYMLHLINLDGKPCDKLKVMGLATKKTTLPKMYQVRLNDILEDYLKTENWDRLADEVVKFKDELLITDDVSVLGLPKGVKQVERYTEELRLDSTIKVPGHVRAAILYNQKLKDYNDTESFPITSNMKIRVYYLKEVQGKYKSIALPTDLDRVPDWFFDLNIDRNAQIERLVDKPLTNVLEAVGKVPPDKQSVLVDTLLDF